MTRYFNSDYQILNFQGGAVAALDTLACRILSIFSTFLDRIVAAYSRTWYAYI